MFCIKCHSKSLTITNSRPHKRSPSTWRRRKCATCGYTFTTSETIVLEDYLMIDDTPFSIPRLTVSLALVLRDEESPADSAYWIARTVGELLLTQGSNASLDLLLETARDTLTRYNPTAGMQYAFNHHLMEATASPRRGRPQLKRRRA